ncbi:hypothetical protein Tdes44962_MAKER09316 [Teratosphaeria destructans]|uniref:Uncharacterized protein n=1 Tax=Teratosphaeria destructans TaxID=418781 RepID=A0A9W7STN8_9PEZI|nr:hypothetical protein Tdes44962_MAKER09316 [Teratosphaeria destructans]
MYNAMRSADDDVVRTSDDGARARLLPTSAEWERNVGVSTTYIELYGALPVWEAHLGDIEELERLPLSVY